MSEGTSLESLYVGQLKEVKFLKEIDHESIDLLVHLILMKGKGWDFKR